MSLLDKFRQKKQGRDVSDNLLEHLSDLLNTKRGFGSYPHDLGLDSYVYLGSDKKITLQIMEDIKHCFAKYEKRVSHLEVVPIESKSRFFLSFLIKCKVSNQACSFHLNFHQQNKSYQIGVEA